VSRDVLKGSWQEQRSFSPAVVTTGGRIVWLAGQGATQDDEGKSLVGDFDGQTRQAFSLISRTLERAGGKLDDIVTMTVFIADTRFGDRFIELRRDQFKNGFPASALLTVSGFARPEMLVEIQAVAVVP
jgi:enamine deaminase RidA (YjgF/YER057c/UK114 family)